MAFDLSTIEERPRCERSPPVGLAPTAALELAHRATLAPSGDRLELRTDGFNERGEPGRPSTCPQRGLRRQRGMPWAGRRNGTRSVFRLLPSATVSELHDRLAVPTLPRAGDGPSHVAGQGPDLHWATHAIDGHQPVRDRYGGPVCVVILVQVFLLLPDRPVAQFDDRVAAPSTPRTFNCQSNE